MDTTALPFRLTPRAASRIAEISAAEGGGKALRVGVSSGGCSGFQYTFALEPGALESGRDAGDLVIEEGGAVVVIDAASLDLLSGAELDYTDALMGAHFAIHNPHAASGCGCGTSFAVE